MRRIAAACLFAAALSGAAFAVEPEERLDDPVLEARAREISRELRCVVCDGEVIDYSNADIARDLRILVRQRLTAGDTDEQVVDYIVERYGEYVRMRPMMNLRNAMLWGGPFLLLVIGGGLAIFYVRNQEKEAAVAAAPLTAEEQAALDRLLQTPQPDGDAPTA